VRHVNRAGEPGTDLMETMRLRVRELAARGLSPREIADALGREDLDDRQRAAAATLAGEEFAMARRRRIWALRQVGPRGREAA
jgi:hypothetical protein